MTPTTKFRIEQPTTSTEVEPPRSIPRAYQACNPGYISAECSYTVESENGSITMPEYGENRLSLEDPCVHSEKARVSTWISFSVLGKTKRPVIIRSRISTPLPIWMPMAKLLLNVGRSSA